MSHDKLGDREVPAASRGKTHEVQVLNSDMLSLRIQICDIAYLPFVLPLHDAHPVTSKEVDMFPSLLLRKFRYIEAIGRTCAKFCHPISSVASRCQRSSQPVFPPRQPLIFGVVEKNPVVSGSLLDKGSYFIVTFFVGSYPRLPFRLIARKSCGPYGLLHRELGRPIGGDSTGTADMRKLLEVAGCLDFLMPTGLYIT